MIKTTILAAVLLWLASSGTAATVNATASATIVKPITVSQTQALTFGTLIKPTSGPGVVTLGTDGSLTLGSNAGSAGAHAAGIYTIGGERNTQVVVSVDPTITLTNSTGGGGETIVASTINDLPAGNSPTLNGSGNTVVHVGAQLTLSDTAVSGAYVGTFNVTAVYP